jgi:PmbA protein
MPDLVDIAVRIAGDARQNEQIETYVSLQRSTDVRAYEGEVEQLSSAESAGIGVRVIIGNRQGFAYVGNVDEKLAREVLNEARDNAAFASPDEFVGLAIPDGVEQTKIDLWRESLGTFKAEDKIALALDLDRRVRAGDDRIRQVISTDYGDALDETAIATSTGIVAASRETTCFLATDVVAGNGDETQTGVGFTVGRSLDELDADFACKDAIERATRLLGSKKPKSARTSVVFDRRVSATLLSILGGTLSGEEAAKGRSLFAGRLGEEVAVESITLVDDPTNPLAFGASHFDAEGLACRRTALIEKGRLSNFLYNTYSARLAGARSTASAVRAGFKSTPGVGAQALALVPGELDQAQMLKLIGEGLFVQSITGVHSGVNPVSGDFSVGAEGLMVRNGELAEPVREFTIASTIQRMLLHVLGIGNDVEWLPGNAMGLSLAIGDCAMSGA